jgi:hypothetical protein
MLDDLFRRKTFLWHIDLLISRSSRTFNLDQFYPARSIILFSAIMFASGCATTSNVGNAGLLLELSRKSTFDLIKEVDKSDLYANGNWIFVRGDSVERVAPHFEAVPAVESLAMTFCGTGFPDQPPLLDGAFTNVFLSDHRIEAIGNVRIEGSRITFQNFSCFTIYGDALMLKTHAAVSN